jgi:hypothetical protein
MTNPEAESLAPQPEKTAKSFMDDTYGPRSDFGNEDRYLTWLGVAELARQYFTAPLPQRPTHGTREPEVTQSAHEFWKSGWYALDADNKQLTALIATLRAEIAAGRQVYSQYRRDMRQVMKENSDEIDGLRAEIDELKEKK